MSSKAQYDAFRDIYQDEAARTARINTVAAACLPVPSFFLSALFFNLKVVLEVAQQSDCGIFVLCGVWFFFLFAILCSVLSFFIRTQEGLFDPNTLAEEIEKNQPSDEQFFTERIADFVVATERNDKVNNRKAFWVRLAQICILLGFLFAVLFLWLAIKGNANGKEEGRNAKEEVRQEVKKEEITQKKR